jgi:hypothetical protein
LRLVVAGASSSPATAVGARFAMCSAVDT